MVFLRGRLASPDPLLNGAAGHRRQPLMAVAFPPSPRFDVVLAKARTRYPKSLLLKRDVGRVLI
jgi:hypothetical protein